MARKCRPDSRIGRDHDGDPLDRGPRAWQPLGDALVGVHERVEFHRTRAFPAARERATLAFTA